MHGQLIAITSALEPEFLRGDYGLNRGLNLALEVVAWSIMKAISWASPSVVQRGSRGRSGNL